MHTRHQLWQSKTICNLPASKVSVASFNCIESSSDNT